MKIEAEKGLDRDKRNGKVNKLEKGGNCTLFRFYRAFLFIHEYVFFCSIHANPWCLRYHKIHTVNLVGESSKLEIRFC